MKNTTILHTPSDAANFALGATTAVTGIVVALIAKKKLDKAMWRFVSGSSTPLEN